MLSSSGHVVMEGCGLSFSQMFLELPATFQLSKAKEMAGACLGLIFRQSSSSKMVFNVLLEHRPVKDESSWWWMMCLHGGVFVISSQVRVGSLLRSQWPASGGMSSGQRLEVGAGKAQWLGIFRTGCRWYMSKG